MKNSEVFWKINVLDIEAKYHRSDKIQKVSKKSLSVCLLTKSFALLVSILLPFHKQFVQILYDANNGYKTQHFLR